MNKRAQQSSAPRPAAAVRLTQAEIDTGLRQLPGWEYKDGALVKVFSFGNYAETVAFANALAWIAARENHHPDLLVTYDRCRIAYTTHSVGGVSGKDVICATKIEALCLI